MVILGKGEHVWIEPEKPGEFAVSIGARVLTSAAGRTKLLDDDGVEHWVDGSRKLRHMHVTSVEGVEDMIGLGDLNESGILRNLFIRYMDHNIYTYTGSILVAVNPYEILPIYTPEQMMLYRDTKIGELPPHIFAIADNAYSSMKRYQHDQCVIISGESGAGKTESTKLILQFLASVSGQHSWIEQQILEANPVMEAFGNAKTIRNDNSSRFGKYIDIHFNDKGVIEGAKIEQYLLEKSRIVSQMREERNYHIFYCMLAGMTQEEKAKLELHDAVYYKYLTQGGGVSCDSRNDKTDFLVIKSALKVLMFTDTDIWDIMKVLAALLHLGNIRYNNIEVDHIEATEIVDVSYINKVARLFEINAQSLVDALTTRTLVTRGEVVNFPMNKEQSQDVRDAFVKGIYGRLFVWIVDKINAAIYKPKGNQYRKSIGVLDIFGFENFDFNSFEQLCINYANENLQQFFVRHIFKLEQAEYNLEGINWKHIEFVDNQDSLDLIVAKPMNIIALIDEESMFPKGTDESLLHKLHQYHSNHPNYVRPRSGVTQIFGINHYAGVVFYGCRGFLEKNRDTFSGDLTSLIQVSKNVLLKLLFTTEISQGTRKKSPTLATQFKKSLDQLMAALSSSQPFFVRCIKPNDFKRPLMFNRELCCRQLRYSGMMETIRIRRAGYPIRHNFTYFVDRYRLLADGIGPSHKEDCRRASLKICSVVLKDADYQLGKTKVFLKDAQDVFLEQQREIFLTRKILVIQKMVRAWYQRRRFLKMRKAIVCVQSALRAHHERKSFLVRRQGYLRLQAMVRTQLISTSFAALRQWTLKLQSRCRGHLIRQWMRRRKDSVLFIQAAARTIVAQRNLHLLKLKVRKKSEAEETRRREEAEFRKSMNPKAASEKAQRQYEDRLLNPTIKIKNEEQLQKLKLATAPDQDAINEIEDAWRLIPGDTLSAPLTPADNEYTFAKFAAAYFQGNATGRYIQRPLKQPLLKHVNSGDQLAALAVWIVILRFMSDLPEPRHQPSGLDNKDNIPVMTKIYSTLGRKFSKKHLEAAMNMGQQMEYGTDTMSRAAQKKMISHTLKKKSKITAEMMAHLQDDAYDGEVTTAGNVLLEDRPMSNLEKLHYIIGHGILRPLLRDEILCQICKQLTDNYNKRSHSRGWILLCLCLRCFPPSKQLEPCLINFIEQGPPGFSSYCLKQLNRTVQNGSRTQPPTWAELEASKNMKDLFIPVTCMDGLSKTLTVDSATIASEVCQQLSREIGLKDLFGFSIVIAIYDKVAPLLDGDHVMDAVSQCEQYAKEQGLKEQSAPWKLYFRKTVFAPWHDTSQDQVATHLIYQQVVRGIKSEEYKTDKDEDLALIAAQQIFIEFGAKVDPERLKTQLSSYIPSSRFQDPNSSSIWNNAVLNALRSPHFQNSKLDPSKVKESVVNYARHKWPLVFSRFYEARKISGPSLPNYDITLAVNWTGVYVINEQEQVLLELSFPEIKSVTSSRSGRTPSQSLVVTAVSQEEYQFACSHAEDASSLISTFLVGLKKRSKFAVATQDYKPPDNSPTILTLKKGDLIILDPGCSSEAVMNSGVWGQGEHESTRKRGDFPAECVYILPTLTKPPAEIMNLFVTGGTLSRQVSEDNSSNQRDNKSSNLHTLEQFSMEHFRSPAKRTFKGTLNSTLLRRHEELWRHSKEPIKQPLLKKLVGNDLLSDAASNCFLNILKFMGDYPSQKGRTVNEFTDLIFQEPLKQEVLRDEVYCQIMKQLTHNKNSVSEERGWQLMWLATGCFVPSSLLQKELSSFLQTRSFNDIATDSLKRLRKCLRSGARKYPPELVEVEAIQHKLTQITHEVHFPDDSKEEVPVESCTRTSDLCQLIAKKLDLKSAEGFSMFLKFPDKVLSVPEEYFFFDFVHEQMDQLHKDGALNRPLFTILFLKKLWVRITPGKDVQADIIFHYHQELPKYIIGNHKCTQEDATLLAALIYRALYEDDRTNLSVLQDMLRHLIPKYLENTQSASKWKKAITQAYEKDSGMSRTQAKVQFLKIISKWPLFGSTFFDIKQSSLHSFPDKLIIAINMNGISLIHPQSKDILATFPISEISNWSSGNTYFLITIGNAIKATRFVCETSRGYIMDDLLNSYIKLWVKMSQSRR